eukprot:scaffold4541_cov95-Isochrysis_galbana.AAC.3
MPCVCEVIPLGGSKTWCGEYRWGGCGNTARGGPAGAFGGDGRVLTSMELGRRAMSSLTLSVTAATSAAGGRSGHSKRKKRHRHSSSSSCEESVQGGDTVGGGEDNTVRGGECRERDREDRQLGAERIL